MPRDEAIDAKLLWHLEVPHLVQQPAQRAPRVLIEQKVVALRDHERDLPPDPDGTGDGLFQVPAERGRIDRWLGVRVHPGEQCDVPVGVERFRSTLAPVQAEPDELGVGEVEPVHAEDDDVGTKLLGERRGEGGLARARGAGDPEDRAAPRRAEPSCPLRQLGQTELDGRSR